MKDVYIVQINIIRNVGHRGCRSNHTRRPHKKSPRCNRQPEKPPGARQPNLNCNAKFILRFSQGEFGFLRYNIKIPDIVALCGTGCRDPPRSIVL